LAGSYSQFGHVFLMPKAKGISVNGMSLKEALTKMLNTPPPPRKRDKAKKSKKK